MRTLTRTCEGLEYCAHWVSHDRDCGQLTAAHSAYCEDHADMDADQWHGNHEPGECCADCCGEGGCHA